MNEDRIIASRRDKYNKAQSEYARYYSEPLDKAIVLLRERHNYTFEQIAQELYDGEVSKQAIHLRFKKIKEGGDQT